MKLHHIPLTKTHLDAVPEYDRTFIILLCHSVNELNILGRLFEFTMNQIGDDPVLNEVQNAQAMTLIKILSGKTFGCWQLFNKKTFRILTKIYRRSFNDDAIRSYTSLELYFNDTKSRIKMVRDNYSFHHSSRNIPDGYKMVTEGDNLSIYLSESNGNTLYAFAEMIVNRPMIEDLNPANHTKVLEEIMEEVGGAIKSLNTVITECLKICIDNHFDEDITELIATPIDIPDLRNFDDVKIPYFVEMDKNRQTE